MIAKLSKIFVAVALTSLLVSACDTPQRDKVGNEEAAELVDRGNARCVFLIDENVLCASSKLREPIQVASFAVL